MSALLPTLRQLSFLTALADHESFSRAAEHCFVTQPTLSAGIKELETILGVTLVERGARQAVLTPAGEIAVERARRTLTEAEDLVQATRAAGEPLCGPFRLGVIPTIAPFLLPRAVPVLRQAFPDLKLLLREDLTGRLYEALKDRRIDAALIALPYDDPAIKTESAGPDEFLFACAPGHPLAERKTVSLEDVTADPLLLLEDGHCLRDHAVSACASSAARSDFAATSLHTLVQMVKGGVGATLLPRLAIEGGVADGLDLALIPFDPPVIGREIGIAWRRGSARAEEARLIAKTLRDMLAERA
ncbi:hydrogen peroxide-inducible genes activator [Hyphobacterium marinum]|uniref:Hydrogen peroxide-inducible genes activator n=1 Tax=Hyphobacterium marinum TaxID=3116574 RepID=A0ABU7LVM7_9PROT|nr:hydrogen peroxide-inducible genes activator [Hyphobacterium sp. Y6023]MEE2565619.1 hydrogen peroxide-inducible genes activator [Hyphobacterium sp. Y6023]